ncbi:hypothetical protein GCM10028799_34740 [Kribbella italica]
MAHHLAALVTAADGADEIAVEQRVEIVKTILMVWGARRRLPGDPPAHELDMVLSALDVLGDDRPWKFSRLQKYADGLDTAEAAGVPLVVKAASLERLTRQAVLALFWLACQEAASHNEDWLVTVTAAVAPLEDELTSTTRRVHRRLREFIDAEQLSGADADKEAGIDTSVLALGLRAMGAELVAIADELETNRP